MDQRTYYGNINPHALADYLVGVYRQPRTLAQKIIQGERIFVQIMRNGSDWSGSGHRAIGVHIQGIAGGISIEMGASDWMGVDEVGLAGLVLGTLFFPPLLLFPLIQGLTSSNFSHEIWSTIDIYCTQLSRTTPRPQSPGRQGFYCTYCGAFNHPAAPACHACHAPFKSAAARPAATPEPTPGVSSSPDPEPEVSAPKKTGNTRPMFALVVCPACKATVVPAHFCGNCAAPLPDVHEEAKTDE